MEFPGALRDKKVGTGRRGDVTPVAVMLVLLGTGLGGLGGYVTGGALMGFLGLLVGITLCVALHVTRRAARLHRGMTGLSMTGELPGDPEQALAVLATMPPPDGGSRAISSDVLRQLEEVRRDATADVGAILARLDELACTYPRAPAILAERTRCLMRASRPDEAAEAAATAIRLAIVGGMNPLAARLFDEFRPLRQRLVLDAATREQLGRVLDRKGDDDGKTWCASPEGDDAKS